MSSTPSTPWDGVPIIRVWFPDRSVCEDCGDDDYEDIVVNTRTDTIGQVKNAIAAKLCIDADEFLLDYEYGTTRYESVSGILFATAYMNNNGVARLLEEYENELLHVYLYENKAYRGKTGMLKWILSQKMDFYCGEFNTSGQLAERLARHIAAFKAQDGTLSTTVVPNEEQINFSSQPPDLNPALLPNNNLLARLKARKETKRWWDL